MNNILVKAHNTKQLSQLSSLIALHTIHSRAEVDEVSSAVIHPTAVVHPNASLGHGVSIGPFCTVGSSAKLGNACKLYPSSHIFGDTQLGDHCTLMTGAVVGDELPGKTVIGSNNVIGHHAVVGVRCQDLKYKIGDECSLYIGDNNDIREYCSIHRSSKPDDKTVIGDKNLIMGLCHIAHDCKIGRNNILANNTMLAGHVVLEDYIHTAGAVVVHQHCHLGSFCFIGGGSVISQDVPKFMLVSGERAELRGLNLEGLRRHGFSVTEIKSLRAAYRKIFMSVDAESGSLDVRLMEVEQHEELGQVNVISSMVQSIRDSFKEPRREFQVKVNVERQYNVQTYSTGVAAIYTSRLHPGGMPFTQVQQQLSVDSNSDGHLISGSEGGGNLQTLPNANSSA